MISKVLFENKKMGIFPYKNYNTSIIKLNKEETLKITDQKYNQESVLIIFFAAAPTTIMGTMSFIGLISHEMLIRFLQDKEFVEYDNFWIIKPHLLQNDKGPKCADLRIFKMKQTIGIIGYSRVAAKSNTPNIADYYVRASLLDRRINDNLYKKSENLYSFNEIDGGCFPYKIGDNYKKFILENDNSKINNIEFFIRNNEISKLVTPHKSKHNLMPNSIKLNGIEVSFSKTSSNEEARSHISTKNIIPIQHINPLDTICGFIDVIPPNINMPNLTIQDIETGKVFFTDYLDINDIFKSKKYRGSTPFIELSNNMWITMVHVRYNSKGLMYRYYYQIYDNKEIIINNTKINIPNKCIHEILFDEKEIYINKFIFIMGMIIEEQIYVENNIKLKLILSYGISDSNSGIALVDLNINISENINKLPKLHIIHRIDKTNTGDIVSNCSEYYSFEQYKIIKHDIYKPDFDKIMKNEPIILSGGGLLNCLDIWNRNINKLLEISDNVFGWGIGFNKHYDSKNINNKINLSKFKLLGLRDYKPSYESNARFVPCASCNLTQITNDYKIKRNVGVIEHHHNKITLKEKYDKINNGKKIDDLIKFIGESNIIITNTYHALYFSALLNKKCILYNSFSEKFNYIKFHYIKYDDNMELNENNKELNEILVLNKELLKDYIKINNIFYSDIMSKL